MGFIKYLKKIFFTFCYLFIAKNQDNKEIHLSGGLIKNTAKSKEDEEYEELIFGENFDGNKQNPTSNFSNYGNDESITFIDPTFEKVTSSSDILDDSEIIFDSRYSLALALLSGRDHIVDLIQLTR